MSDACRSSRVDPRLRAAILPVLAGLLAAFAVAPARAQSTPSGFEEGLVAVVARDLPPLTYLVLADSSGTLFMPLQRISESLGILIQRPDSFHVVIPRSDRGNTIVDLRAHTITGGGRTEPYSPAELVVANGDVFVTTARLASLLQATATLDAATLTLLLVRDPPFPAQQRIAIEQRRALLVARDRASQTFNDADIPLTPVTGPGVLDWEVTSSSIDVTRLVQMRLRAGAAVLGGGLTVGGAAFIGSDAGPNQDHDFTARYHRVFPTSGYVTQVEAGDVITTGLFARFMRGVQVTNAPPHRNYDLGSILLRPDLPAGWEYEVLQNGQLIGFSDAVSHDAVAIPLRTGASPVSVRLYGPGGQQVETELLYQTPATLLPRGRFEYSASAGHCDGSVCDGYAQLDARYAHWTRLTLGAGAEYLTDSISHAMRPYALASFATGTFLTGEVQLMPDAVYRGTFAVFPSETGTGTLTTGLSMPGYGRVSIVPDTKNRWDVDAAWDQRLAAPVGPFRSLRAGFGAQAQTDGSASHTRLSIGSTLDAGYAEARWESGSAINDMFSTRASILVHDRRLPLGLRPLVDGGFGIDRHGISLLHAGISAQHDNYGNGSLSLEWARGAPSARLTLSWSRTFHDMQAIARAVADGSRNASSTFSVRGAVSVAPNGDVATGAFAREGYGGIYGRVFLDHDGDGKWSAGDEPVPDVGLIVGGMRASTDSAGLYHAWSIQPYDAISVSIDSTSAGDPGWVTREPRILVRPVPNTSIVADVALIETREAAGTVVATDGVATAAGVTVQLTPVNGGAAVTTSTFSDGEYYLTHVRPGRYNVTISRSSLDALHAALDNPVVIDIPASGPATLVEVPAMTIRPAGLPVPAR